MRNPVFKLFAAWCFAAVLFSGLTYFVKAAFSPEAALVVGLVCAAAMILDLLWIGLLCCQNFMMLPPDEQALRHASQGVAMLLGAVVAFYLMFEWPDYQKTWIEAVVAIFGIIGAVRVVAGFVDLRGYPFRLIPVSFALVRLAIGCAVLLYNPATLVFGIGAHLIDLIAGSWMATVGLVRLFVVSGCTALLSLMIHHYRVRKMRKTLEREQAHGTSVFEGDSISKR